MVTILRKLFIKNYEDINNTNVRYKHIQLGYFFNILTNLVILILKIVLLVLLSINNSNISGNSILSQIIPIALLADTINTFGDIVLSCTTLIACKLSNKEPDQEHPFGHGRIEEIMSLCVASFIVAFSIELSIESITKIIEGTISTWDITSIIILSVSIFIKIIQGIFNLKLGKIISSTVLKSTAFDSFFDSLSTSLILLSSILSVTLGLNNLDGLFGLLISIFICIGGFKLIIDTSKSLMGTACNKQKIKELEKKVLSYNKVYGVHDIRVHKYGPIKTFITLHIEVPYDLTLQEAHDIADEIERDIEKNNNYFITIHVDPSSTEQDLVKYKQIVNKAIKDINPKLDTHDFQLSKHDGGRDRLSFDVLIPFELYESKFDYKKQIIHDINESLPDLEIVIGFDHPF